MEEFGKAFVNRKKEFLSMLRVKHVVAERDEAKDVHPFADLESDRPRHGGGEGTSGDGKKIKLETSKTRWSGNAVAPKSRVNQKAIR